MPNINAYIENQIDKDGKVQPFSRFDVLVSVVFLFSIIVFTVMFAAHDFVDRRSLAVLIGSGIIGITIFIFHRLRFAFLTAGLAFMALRFALATAVMSGHRWASAGLAIVCAFGAYLCLRKSVTNENQSSSKHAMRS